MVVHRDPGRDLLQIRALALLARLEGYGVEGFYCDLRDASGLKLWVVGVL